MLIRGAKKTEKMSKSTNPKLNAEVDTDLAQITIVAPPVIETKTFAIVNSDALFICMWAWERPFAD